jgi:phosphopantothenoylcysteine decarboxylase/phosphopantothenate--cysteine ligase
MGYAVAEAALARGACVTLVTGPVSIPPPDAARTIKVKSARDMYEAVMANLESATMLVMAAAVADYRPARKADQKIKKNGGAFELELEQTEDILAAAGQVKGSRVVVGFAAETENVVANAEKKLKDKNTDLIVANDVSAPDAGFDVETNRVTLISSTGAIELPLLTKRETADRIIEAALKIKRSRAS